MNTLHVRPGSELALVAPARGRGVRDWQRWAPYAAVAWSLVYAALGVTWALGGRGFPYPADSGADPLGPLAGRFGPGVAWLVVLLAGLPAAATGVALLRGVRGRALRPLLITAGALLAGVLLLLTTGLNLLVMLGYIPYAVRALFMGDEFGPRYLAGIAQWTIVHQLLCLLGGFLWLGATTVYARRSADACVYCGRRNGPARWQSEAQAARWGRAALYVSLVAPVFYALTRYAWAVGIPLGMSEEYLHSGQESGTWVSGLFLATFGLVGAGLTLGLAQRWGEVFPRWMPGLAGRRVPLALAVVPAALVSVLLIVGGVGIWAGLGRMVAALAAGGAEGMELVGAIAFQVGPTLLFPVWGIALAVATLGYYYRRRGGCRVCGRGAAVEAVAASGDSFIKRHALLAYFALVFAISWGGMLLVVGPGGIPATGEHSELLLWAYLALLAGPSVAGILLTGFTGGRTGLREFRSRWLRWRVGGRWYAVALLTAPLLMLAVLLALALSAREFLPRLLTTDDRLFLLQFSLVSALVVGILEELGWTGFAVPRLLRQGHSVLATGLFVGLLVGAWDLLMVYWMSAATGTVGTLPMAIFLPAALFTWLPTYRVLMVWVYDRTDSLLLAILMHTSLITFWTSLTPVVLTGMPLVTYYLVLTAALWVVIGVVALANHGRLSRRPLSGQMA